MLYYGLKEQAENYSRGLPYEGRNPTPAEIEVSKKLIAMNFPFNWPEKVKPYLPILLIGILLWLKRQQS